MSRYWTTYPTETEFPWESMTQNQAICLFLMWGLVYWITSRFVIPLANLLISGFITYQLYLHQQEVLNLIETYRN